MNRMTRSPVQSTPINRTLLETRSEPDLSPGTSPSEGGGGTYDLTNISTRPSNKRFRGDDSFVAQDRFEELRSMLLSFKSDQDKILNKLVAEIADLKQQNLEILKSHREFDKTVQFINASYDEMKARLGILEENVKRCQALASNSGDQKVALLEAKIDSMEQQARQCNVEICNLPEKRTENLLSIMEAIGTAIKFPLSQNDIISIHRVPHARQQDITPKNIVVKLKSRIVCDNILSAYRKVKSVKSDQIGIAGAAVSVYLNEHLTLKNKALFREAKILANKYGYRYVWVRNGTILVREQEGISAFAIRSDDDLKKITEKEKTGNENSK